MSEYLFSMMPALLGIAKALLLLIAAFIVAAIVKKLITVLLKRILPDSITLRNPDFCKSLIAFIARVSYIVVFLLFIPGIFAIMGVNEAARPIVTMLEGIVNFIPNIIVAVVIIYIGITLSKLCAALVERVIKSSKLDEFLIKIMSENRRMLPASKFVSTIVEILLIIFFFVQGLDVLHLKVLDKIGSAVIAYIPCVLAAAVIFTGCFLIDTFVASVLEKGEHYGIAMLTKVIIYVIGVFMILSQLGIAAIIVNSAFIIIIAAIAVAFAISFGFGGREFAAKILRQLEETWKKG